jgi:dTDP-4-dehydrorhamnose 3,5-epimerase-like enzyme
MSLVNIVHFPSLGDDRGELTVLEQNDLVPFDIKRVYYIYNTIKNISRGFHAHKNLEQLAICISGSCLILLDDGNKKENVLLDNPNKGLLINKMIWHEMSNFSSDCILMVLASDFYDEDDYIRSYEAFKELI